MYTDTTCISKTIVFFSTPESFHTNIQCSENQERLNKHQFVSKFSLNFRNLGDKIEETTTICPMNLLVWKNAFTVIRAQGIGGGA